MTRKRTCEQNWLFNLCRDVSYCGYDRNCLAKTGSCQSHESKFEWSLTMTMSAIAVNDCEGR